MTRNGSVLFTQIIVGIADMKATNSNVSLLSTYSLGSCLAVSIYDPEVQVGGLLHFMLPDSTLDRKKAMSNPFLFADTGIPLLFRRAYTLGAVKERIICKLAGACDVIDPGNIFAIGSLNHLAARKVLSKNNVIVHAEHVGGMAGMAMTLHMDTGRVVVNLPDGKEVEI